MRQSPVRKIILLWLAWLVILFTYQAAVTARYAAQKPDHVLPWTAALTDEQTLAKRRYLSEPFMNAQVGWDSEFYLSIAVQGYDDPQVRTAPAAANAPPPFNRPLSLNYAFFPVYPYLLRLVAVPLGWFGLNAIAAATLAGVVISAVGTLIGMLALYALVQTEFPQELGEPVGLRTVFYLVSFPTSFFLAQVYTEGLFIGLSFGCLALLQQKRWIAAGLLAAVATLTRAVGVVLLIPILLSWLPVQSARRVTFRTGLQAVALLSPLMVHLVWKFSFLGRAFQIVEQQFFNCRLFNLQAAFNAWSTAFLSLFANHPAAIVHYGIEFAAVLLGIASCLLTIKRYPGISIYGLIIIIVSTTCGTAWSISRYLLTIPSTFLVLGRLGQSALFDRVWSLISILLLAMLTALFSFDLWAG